VRLLLIEDEVRLVQLLNAALARANFAVDAVGTSADGRAALAAALYDALILDLGLPDGDGLALLRDPRKRKSGFQS
jgi:two-component system response regulator QseB